MTRFLMAFVFVAVATTVEAHALLVRTAPPKRAVLRDPPRQVELWFNERLEPSTDTSRRTASASRRAS